MRGDTVIIPGLADKRRINGFTFTRHTDMNFRISSKV